MTTRACPSCGQALDPLRAPVARIVGGKVLAYCSAECAAGGASVAVPRSYVEIETVVADVGGSAQLPAVPARPDSAAPIPAPREVDLTPQPIATDGALAPMELPRRSRWRWWLAAALLGALGALGGALASGRRAAPAAPREAVRAAAQPVVEAPSPGRAAAPPVVEAPSPGRAAALGAATLAPAAAPLVAAPVDRAALLREARATLAASLADPSPRVRLLAATALARSHEPAALSALAAALAEDPSEIRRLEVGQALARAGDARGTEYLVGALKSSRRDVRLEAARALALLGDDRGKDRLREALDAVQLRLGAAENLAALGDAKAVAVLKEALAGKEAEPRLRAAVALGRAGDASGKDVLIGLVNEGRLEIGAEDALARLGDHAAIPALERALGLGAVRVQAAVDLRRLGVEPDLAVLDRALAGSDVVGKISAAEALLVLLLPEPPPEIR
jgi:HEAT repeat protein